MTTPATVPPPLRAQTFEVGGPFEDLLRRLGLSQPGAHGVVLRSLAFVGIAWLPLLVLSSIEGRAWGGTDVPFLADAYVGARLLVVIPLLLAAEALLAKRFPAAIGRFSTRAMVAPEEQVRFSAIVGGTLRIAGAWPVELGLLAVVVALGAMRVSHATPALAVEAWYAAPLAGGWLLWVSAPLFQFVVLRWYLRLAMWWLLMLRVSRLSLQLEPLHPDKAGGLGFLGQLCLAFVPFALAQGAMAAGWIANQIFHGHARLLDYRLEIAACAGLVVLAIVGPLFAFVPRLVDSKRAGLSRYGNLATGYAREFESRWLRPGEPPRESVVGSGDIQSLADLGNSYSTLQQMRAVPFGMQVATTLAIAVLAPMAPLLLTAMSTDELLSQLGKLLF